MLGGARRVKQSRQTCADEHAGIRWAGNSLRLCGSANLSTLEYDKLAIGVVPPP